MLLLAGRAKGQVCKTPRMMELCDKENRRGRCSAFLFPGPSPMAAHNHATPQDEGKGVCCPFPNFGPITWLLFQLSPGGSRPTSPLCLPLRAALLSQVGAHCLGCCPQMVVQLMHFFRSSS